LRTTTGDDIGMRLKFLHYAIMNPIMYRRAASVKHYEFTLNHNGFEAGADPLFGSAAFCCQLGTDRPDASGRYSLYCSFVAHRRAGVLAASRVGGRVHLVDEGKRLAVGSRPARLCACSLRSDR
jgi:hypothetical protein